MTPIARTNMLLTLAVAVLAILVLFSIEVEKPPLTDLQPEQITRVRISDNGQFKEYRREGGTCQVADAQALERLVQIASTPSLRSFPIDQANPVHLGLKSAQIRIQLNELELILGGTEPINGRRYVQIGRTVHLIEDKFHQALYKIRASQPASGQNTRSHSRASGAH